MQKARTLKIPYDEMFREIGFGRGASSVTGDEPTSMTLTEVDASGDAQYSDKQCDESPDDSSDRAS